MLLSILEFAARSGNIAGCVELGWRSRRDGCGLKGLEGALRDSLWSNRGGRRRLLIYERVVTGSRRLGLLFFGLLDRRLLEER